MTLLSKKTCRPLLKSLSTLQASLRILTLVGGVSATSFLQAMENPRPIQKLGLPEASGTLQPFKKTDPQEPWKQDPQPSQGEGDGLSTLPDEILGRISSSLDGKSAHNAVLVNKRFQRVLEKHFPWKIKLESLAYSLNERLTQGELPQTLDEVLDPSLKEVLNNRRCLSLDVSRLPSFKDISQFFKLVNFKNKVDLVCRLSHLPYSEPFFKNMNLLQRLTLINPERIPFTLPDTLNTLPHLKTLILGESSLTNISPLSTLTDLKTLNLSINKISDLSPVSTLTNLKTLNLAENQISDLSPLSTLTALQTLNLQSNQISDLSPLMPLTRLRDLDLRVNPIRDLAQLDLLPVIPKTA